MIQQGHSLKNKGLRAIKVFWFKCRRLFYRHPPQLVLSKRSNSLNLSSEALKLLKNASRKNRQNGASPGSVSIDQVRNIAVRASDPVLKATIESIQDFPGSWGELKNRSEVMRFTGDHAGYEQMLQHWDAGLQLLSFKEAEECEFVGSGLGDDTLNAYRRLKWHDTDFFEKIYLNDSADLTRLMWFIEYAAEQVQSAGIHFPKVLKVHSGRHLTAIYFEYMDQPLDNCSPMPEKAIDVALRLYPLRFDMAGNQGARIEEFEALPIYQQCYALLEKWLEEQGENPAVLKNWEEAVKRLPRQLSHGDLHGKNMGAPNIVIDWDRAGLYPLGFDIAYAMSNNYVFTDLKDWEAFIERQCRSVIKKEDWPDFLMSTTYFSLLFYVRKMGGKILPREFEKLKRFLFVLGC